MITTVVIKNPNHVKNALNKERDRGVDAAKNAIFKESLRLKEQLRKEIRAGSPGGQAMAPLGMMALQTKRGVSDRKPLVRIAFMMRFNIFHKASTWYAKLGYVPKSGGGYFPKGAKISWGKILEHMQAGFTLPVTPGMRRKFVRMAMGTLGSWQKAGRSGAKTWKAKKQRKGTWQKAGRSGGRTFVEREKSPYFIRSGTTFKIPARPFIEPFWKSHRTAAMENMRRHFKQTMKDKVLNG